MKAPNRSQAGEIAKLKSKCDLHATAILSNSVTHAEAQLAYHVYHLTSIGYSLAVTYITEHEFNTNIQGRAVSAFLAASGYNRHFPRAIAFSPKMHGGIGFIPLYLLQGQQSLRTLQRHILHQTALGKHIIMDLAWIQQEAGTSQTYLSDTHSKLDYIQDGWLVGVRRFLTTVSTTITFTDEKKPQTYRHGDKYIMDSLRLHNIPTRELRILNRCMLYFQVARLSDVTTLEGTNMYPHVLALDREAQPAISIPSLSHIYITMATPA
jgi:hypothetical protein